MKLPLPRILPWATALALTACSGGSSSSDVTDDDGSDSADLGGGGTVTCSFSDHPTPLGDNSEALAEAVVRTRHITKANLGKQSKKIKGQLMAAFVQLEMASPGDDLAALIAGTDEEQVDFLDVTITSSDPELNADWISFFSGDTEVGVVFANNTIEVIGQISDGDIQGCTQTRQCGGHAALGCADDEFCEFEFGCGQGDVPGVCKKRPEACLANFDPVCGCDGKTHSNACQANGAGTDAAQPGECLAQGEACGLTTCDAGEVCCNPLASICTLPGEVCIQ